ncbi:MAG TPA: GNAT family N-acetyltransferase [Acidimicrobiales bacterium]|nr:GNAT family N-acetyltransferase [Acidimicrobiales bacterium]
MAGRLDHVVIAVEAAVSVDDDLVAAVGVLLPQLSSSSPAPSKGTLSRIVADPGTTLFVARDGEAIVGMLTLVTFEIPTARRAWIEDVVTHDAARGKGVASALVNAALDHASARGVHTVDLTSRPEREDANRLYVKLGFEQRTTNVYRRTLDPRA